MATTNISSGAPSAAPPPRLKPGVRRTPGARRIRNKELPTFSRMIAAMLDSGIPLVQSLAALEEQTQSRSFRAVIGSLRVRIEGGEEFSSALREFPDIFDELYVSMMRAGEAGGLMAEVAGRIARYLETSLRLKRKVRAAMAYPIAVLSLAFLVTTSMLLWLVPVFRDIYAEFDAELPFLTRMLVGVSDAIQNHAIFVFGGLFLLGYGFHRFRKTPGGAYAWDRFKLRVPIVGEIVAKIALSRFASTLAQLIRSGVPILEALNIVAFATGNRVYERIILGARATVESGELLSTELAKHREFSRILIQMLFAGERTGKMDDMLQRVADFYEDEVDATLSGLTSVIEPLMMVILGLVIGTIVVGMFLPIFKLSEVIKF
jgi:type IV pilus assembly protein PilC